MWDWIIPSAVNAVTNVIVPVSTPSLNKHVVGSGIIGWYFVVAAGISLLISVLSGTLFQEMPNVWVLLSGVIYGGGMLAIQKATERAPDPGVSTAIPMSRAFLTALFAYFFLSIAIPWKLYGTYILQAVLCIILVIVIHYYNPMGEPVSWYVYSVISILLLSLSDIILKRSGSTDDVLGQMFWFTLMGAAVALVMNYKKTGSFGFSFREKDTVKDTEWYKDFIGVAMIFYIKILTQFMGTIYSPNPAYPRIITSIAVPITAIVSRWTHRRTIMPIEIVILSAMTITTIWSGVLSSTG